jgi:hypothetical protein
MNREENVWAGDLNFLAAVQPLLALLQWWVNRKDAEGNNLFQGGFLGLDNIGIRSQQGSATRASSRWMPPVGWA